MGEAKEIPVRGPRQVVWEWGEEVAARREVEDLFYVADFHARMSDRRLTMRDWNFALQRHLADTIAELDVLRIEDGELRLAKEALDCGLTAEQRTAGKACPTREDCAECKLHVATLSLDCGLRRPQREAGAECLARLIVDGGERCADCEAAAVARDHAKETEADREELAALRTEVLGLQTRLAIDPARVTEGALLAAQTEAQALRLRLDCGLGAAGRSVPERCKLAVGDGPGDVCAECMFAGVTRSMGREHRQEVDAIRHELAIVREERDRFSIALQKAERATTAPRAPRKPKPPDDAPLPGQQGLFTFDATVSAAPAPGPVAGRKRRSDAGKPRGPRKVAT